MEQKIFVRYFSVGNGITQLSVDSFVDELRAQDWVIKQISTDLVTMYTEEIPMYHNKNYQPTVLQYMITILAERE